eukprot:6959447-Lingulodinium_polyedra.AAC.1
MNSPSARGGAEPRPRRRICAPLASTASVISLHRQRSPQMRGPTPTALPLSRIGTARTWDG